jgi:alpha,alpha-trehalase
MDDVELAEGLNATEQAQLFAQISSTCESGWDFSSRWMENKTNMATLQTNQIIPVDLNSILNIPKKKEKGKKT